MQKHDKESGNVVNLDTRVEENRDNHQMPRVTTCTIHFRQNITKVNRMCSATSVYFFSFFPPILLIGVVYNEFPPEFQLF